MNGENAGLKYLAEEDYFECSGTSENALLQNEKTILKNAVSQAAGTGVMKAGEQEIFVETYEKNPRLIILGGGHVSQPVAEIGRLLGFHITVMDDGMIGSKTKVRITREKLLAEGFTQEQLDQIHAPIGLPIGGQMPAEIAVSIMAEIVQEKN